MAKPFIPDRDRSSLSSRLAGDVGARVPGLRAREQTATPEVRDELAPLNFFETAYAPKSLQVSVRLNSAREQGQNSAIWGEVFCNCCRYRRGSYFGNEPSIQKRQRYLRLRLKDIIIA